MTSEDQFAMDRLEDWAGKKHFPVGRFWTISWFEDAYTCKWYKVTLSDHGLPSSAPPMFGEGSHLDLAINAALKTAHELERGATA